MITSYEDLTYSAYLRLIKAAEGATDSEQRTTALLEVLTGQTAEELRSLPLKEYSALVEKAEFLSQPPKNTPVRKEYKVGNYILVPTIKMEDMTAGQYIDFQTHLKADNQLELLSCLLVPRGCRYLSGYDVTDLQAALREHLSAADGVMLRSFFLCSLLASTATTLTSLVARATKGKARRKLKRETRALRRSLRGGDGWLSRMQWLQLTAALGRPL